LDSRSDNFSVGVVLYEMIAGSLPFSGATSSDVISSIIGKDPPPLARYSADLPPELQWIVSKALRKQCDDRYQTIKEMLSDLRAAGTTAIEVKNGALTFARIGQPENCKQFSGKRLQHHTLFGLSQRPEIQVLARSGGKGGICAWWRRDHRTLKRL
jgi:serine/threonine protein kinase